MDEQQLRQWALDQAIRHESYSPLASTSDEVVSTANAFLTFLKGDTTNG